MGAHAGDNRRRGNMDGIPFVKNSASLPSPSLLLYEEAIRKNFIEAIRIAGSVSRLRPHVKTHKTVEISRLAMSFGIEKFKCATIAEAEMLAAAEAPDILVAYPLVGRNAERFVELVRRYPRTKFSTLVDALGPARRLGELIEEAGISAGAFLDLDVGQHRTGVGPGTVAEELYRFISSRQGLHPAGLHCFDGHNHQSDLGERTAAAEACHAIMDSVRRPLVDAGMSVPEVVMGGTPTFPCYAKMEGIILSPGTCFLHDYSYASSFPDLHFMTAAIILAHVVSRNEGLGTFCIDLGHKGISADPKGLRGKILNLDGCEPLLQNEEHWVFKKPEGQLPEIGDEVYVLPTHICPTVALYERAHIVDADDLWRSEWKIAARDRSIGV